MQNWEEGEIELVTQFNGAAADATGCSGAGLAFSLVQREVGKGGGLLDFVSSMMQASPAKWDVILGK